jgi:hypothetical protein
MRQKTGISIHPGKPSLLTPLLPYTDDPKLKKRFEDLLPVAVPWPYTDPRTSGLTLKLRPDNAPVRRDFVLRSK